MARLSASISIARRFFRDGGGTREREGAATLKPPHPPPSTSIPQCKRPARQRVRGGMGTHNGGLCALSSGYQTSSHNGSVGKERVAVQGWQVIKERLGEAGGDLGGVEGGAEPRRCMGTRAGSHLLLLRHAGDSSVTSEFRWESSHLCWRPPPIPPAACLLGNI